MACVTEVNNCSLPITVAMVVIVLYEVNLAGFAVAKANNILYQRHSTKLVRVQAYMFNAFFISLAARGTIHRL